MTSNKIRVIKDFEKLESDIQEQIKLTYPSGFSQFLITFTDKEGKYVSALPFETEEKYYLVRMNYSKAVAIIAEDDDYDDDGFLKDDAKEEYEDRHSDKDFQIEAEDDAEDDDF